MIAWIQNTVTSEGIIFERLKISKTIYFDLVFESTLFQIIKQKVDEEIKTQSLDFASSFKLVQVLLLPLEDYFAKKNLS